jgi:cytochrome c-type biogenesis protein CcmH
MKGLRGFLLVLAVMIAAPVFAVQPAERLADPALEQRARALGHELRCLVCQNQSIDDSDAALARDLRLLVRERIKAGDSDRQVLDFLVTRYGEFILLRPRVSMQTALLWGLPIVALGLGGLAARALFRRREEEAEPEAPLDADEAKALAAILGERDKPS